MPKEASGRSRTLSRGRDSSVWIFQETSIIREWYALPAGEITDCKMVWRPEPACGI